ncbi:probable cysteine--tRNA ligase, mitochondrial isoform X1 [Dendrobates tinctorius]|uniref:probable cysteine--tRNA ligase, mitochondrial isoform X1 n=1 Tax=Dendrobates tinctorius TaxID=92724 RepID=UPI003CC9913B
MQSIARLCCRRLPGVTVNVRAGGLCTSTAGHWAPPSGYDTGIQVYNSLTKRKEELTLHRPALATWYSCGPTVYDHAHLGHACSYVRFDIIRRILTQYFGIDVVMVMVITDIDDKIIKRASELNLSPVSLARTYEQEFKQDMMALKVLPPTIYMRVTEHIPQILPFIEKIIGNGHAYPTSQGNVYFDVQSIGKRYGKFIGSFSDTNSEPAVSDKRSPRDFALWKTAKPDEPHWVSPWGNGRPGWHIECSTIASTVFGEQLDIHTGGIDLAFPHHENEIAQCEAYHQCDRWGNYFLHSGHLRLKGKEDKMSKSLKNYITVQDFLQSFSSDEFRMFCLRTKYRSAVEYSKDSMSEATNILKIISSFLNEARAYVKGQLLCEPVQEDVLWQSLNETKVTVKAAFADDFDTLGAVNAVLDLIHHGNRQLKAVSKGIPAARSPVVYGAIVSYVEQFLHLLGISQQEKQVEVEGENTALLINVVDEIVDFRSQVRNYALATEETGQDCGDSKEERGQQKERRKQMIKDREPLMRACDGVRLNLAGLGVTIKDRGTVSTWELQNKKENPD